MVWTNATGASQSMYLAVGNANPGSTDSAFSLTATLGAPPSGDLCSNPLTLASGSGTTLGNGRDVLFNSSNVNCTDFSRPDTVYSATVQPNQTITVNATGAAGIDLVLNLFTGPASVCTQVPECLTSADATARAGLETVTWTNSTSVATQVFLKVATYSTPGPYTLTVQ